MVNFYTHCRRLAHQIVDVEQKGLQPFVGFGDVRTQLKTFVVHQMEQGI
jgi:hypothetical protein